jgi:hypothetical protein
LEGRSLQLHSRFMVAPDGCGGKSFGKEFDKGLAPRQRQP